MYDIPKLLTEFLGDRCPFFRWLDYNSIWHSHWSLLYLSMYQTHVFFPILRGRTL